MNAKLLLTVAMLAAVAAQAGTTKKSSEIQIGGRPLTVANPPDNPYAPLLLYDGTWQMMQTGSKPSSKLVTIANDCVRTGVFVVCEQQVDDGSSTLDVFKYAGEPGRYYAQPLSSKAMPMGRGDLTIDGNLWTFSSQEAANGTTKYYRTTNEFSDHNEKINFRVEESGDGRNWTTTLSGIETLIHH